MKKPGIFSELLLICSAAVLFVLILPLPVQARGTWNLYFGQLHSHSGAMDLIGDPETVFASAKNSGMDFFALTDYSHSFQNAAAGSITADGSAISETWAAGKRAAAKASTGNFAALYGYEMCWYSGLHLGHISTFATPGWQCREQQDFQTLPGYYQALTQVPGAIGQFNHPGDQQGNFDGFAHYRWEYDQHMALLEVWGENGNVYLDAYQAALDAGWHVAPTASAASHNGNWGGASQVRTVVLAASLSENALYEAMRERRVYATADPDLSIVYTLGGQVMGSQVAELNSYQLEVRLSDPTSASLGTLQVVSSGGQIIVSEKAESTMRLTVPQGYPYYYLRLLRAGKIIAVTAPVWIDPIDELGISGFSASGVPTQGEPVEFSIEVYNHENLTLTLNAFQLAAEGSLVWESRETVTLGPGESQTLTAEYTHDGLGSTRFSLTAYGSVGDQVITFTEDLTLSYQPAALRAHILVDGMHTHLDSEDIDNLRVLAARGGLDVGIFREALPGGGRVLIIPGLTEAVSEVYADFIREFLAEGGRLILCGSAGNNDAANDLLARLGSTMAFHHDTARDVTDNGGAPDILYPAVFNREASCWENLMEGQFYIHRSGCTLDPGNGQWLVKGGPAMEGTGDVLAAREEIGSGEITIAGSFFLRDDDMPQHANLWDLPRANQTLLESILQVQSPQIPLTNIGSVRSGTLGQVFRVKGYATTGTVKAGNRFPNMIYLQDDTGGIGVADFDIPDIQVGTCLDIIGQLSMDGRNPALKLIRCTVDTSQTYRYAPETASLAAAMDYGASGGSLMKVQGTAQDIEYTADGLGVRRLTLRDKAGNLARVLVEDGILSGADGVNHLASQVMDGKTVRAMGILHLEADGTAVLRVRNCDEVVYVPPVPARADFSNPKTGDGYFGWILYFFPVLR